VKVMGRLSSVSAIRNDDSTAPFGPQSPDPAHPYVNNLGLSIGKQTTYRIGDITNPNLKQWAKDVMKKDNDEVLAGKIAFSPRASCMAAGVPAFLLQGGGNTFFLQTSKQVIMIFDVDAQVRHIYLNVPPRPK
jgi:hypothetical protein